MLKHYFDKHAEEELEKIKFGGRIIDKPKTAFNRQISESVTIQHQKQKSFILNSKSEYNRCALPRLTANLGEIPEKEEKEEEKELQGKIRDLRIKISKSRRETLRETEQPAKKRRKTGTTTSKRVMEQKQEGVCLTITRCLLFNCG